MLSDTICQLFDRPTAEALTQLVADYQAAQVAPWLVAAIEPLRAELTAGLPELEQVEAKARQAKEEAQAAADSAVAEFAAAGADAPLSLQEQKLLAVRDAGQRSQELGHASRQLNEVRNRLIAIDRILGSLGKMEAPDPESVRRIVRSVL